MVTMEILLERSAENSTEPICRKGTREYGDIAETTFQWFIYKNEIFMADALNDTYQGY